MEYCYKCGISDEKALLLDVILLEGIDKICRKCSYNENLPLIKKTNIVEDIQKRPTVHERLSRLSGIEYKKESGNEELKKEETKLNEMVNRNFRRTVGTTNLKDDLIDNFHWIVMRVRRGKHLTQKEMAESIKEPEILVRMLERGIVNDMNIIRKIEEFLSVRLRKKVEETFPEEVEYSEFEIKNESDKFNLDKFRGLRVQDLQEMKEEKESDWAYASPKKGEEREAEVFDEKQGDTPLA